jgi:hypothetical protein
LDNLKTTPSLQPCLPEAMPQADGDARKLAFLDDKLARFGVPVPPERAYPLQCPFSIEQILDQNFFGS